MRVSGTALVACVLLFATIPGTSNAKLKERLAEFSRSFCLNTLALYGRISHSYVLRPTEEKLLTNRFNGSWSLAVTAYRAGEFSQEAMQGLVRYRRRVVDRSMALGRRVFDFVPHDFGSTNITSDLDFSFSGEDNVEAIVYVNSLLSDRGIEPGYKFDVNLYTTPVFGELPPSTLDFAADEIGSLLAIRKFALKPTWESFRSHLLVNLNRSIHTGYEVLLRVVEKLYTKEEALIDEIATGPGLEKNAKTLLAINNRLFVYYLHDLDSLLNKLKTGLEKGTAASNLRDIIYKIRITQSLANYHAADAYLTNSAILHIVRNTQETGRKITSKTLLSRSRPMLHYPMNRSMGRQSFFEQFAQILHYKDGDPLEVAEKVAKYLLRAFDAAHIAGINLNWGYGPLVRRTLIINRHRGKGAILPGLKEAYPHLSPEAAAELFIECAIRDCFRLIQELAKITIRRL